MSKLGNETLWYRLVLTSTAGSCVRTACSYCGQFIYEGYSGVDRVQNAGSYQIDNVVACCNPCNFMKGPSSVKEFLGKVEHSKTAGLTL